MRNNADGLPRFYSVWRDRQAAAHKRVITFLSVQKPIKNIEDNDNR